MNNNEERRLNRLIDKIANEVIDTVVYDAAYHLESAYRRVIDKFYESFSPRQYDRTFSLYKASNMCDDRGGIQNGIIKTNKGYIAALHITTDFYSDVYRAETDWVFQRSFVDGIHGYTHKENEEWANRPGSRWKYQDNPPKDPTFSPKEYLDRWYKHFVHGGELDRITHNAVVKVLNKNIKR